MTVKRFRPICEFVEYDMPIAKMAECPDGYVRGEDYDQAISQRDSMADLYMQAREEVTDLHARLAFAESPEVCTVAHENVETCGYCQRDALSKTLADYENVLIPSWKREEAEWREDEARLAEALGLLRESRESVRKHLHKHQKGLQAAIRRDALDVVALETKRVGELEDLLTRIDSAIGEAVRPARFHGTCACGRPANHWVGGVHLCCECHVKAGHAPADWHPDCMRAAETETPRSEAKPAGRHGDGSRKGAPSNP